MSRSTGDPAGRRLRCPAGVPRVPGAGHERHSVPDGTSDQRGTGSARFLLCHLVSLLRCERRSHPRAQLELINLISTRSCKENQLGGRVGAGGGCAVLPGVRVTRGGYATRAARTKTSCPVSPRCRLRWGCRAGRAAARPQDGLCRSERLGRPRRRAFLLQKMTRARAQSSAGCWWGSQTGALGGGHRWCRWDASPLARGAGGPRGEAVRGRRKKQVHRTYVCEEGKGKHVVSFRGAS